MVFSNYNLINFRKADMSVGGTKKAPKTIYGKDTLVYAKCMKYPPWPAKVRHVITILAS